jgi:predicted phosphoribosyltransferase
MYFTSRAEAGRKIAKELLQYVSANVIIVALSNGAIEVGESIANALRAPLALSLSENVELPGEQSVIGTVSQDGSFVYNTGLSSGEVDEYYSEFHGYIEDQKREKFAKINRFLGEGGFLDLAILHDRIVLLVSDGLKDGLPLEAAAQFLKPIKVKRLVVATPIASVQAVDRMHILADELHCLNVTDNYIDTNHYYDENKPLTTDEIKAKIKSTWPSGDQALPATHQ